MNRNDDRYMRGGEPGYARRDRDRDEWRRGERGRREFGPYDEERAPRDSFYPGNYGFQEGGYSGRTAGDPEHQPYSQNPYGRYPGQDRPSGEWRERSSPRYGQREPYDYNRWDSERPRSSGGSRYSESQYGQQRPADRYGSSREHGEYRERAFDERPFPDTTEPPGYFGTGNYADGGASYGGGFDQRPRSRNYGSFSEDALRGRPQQQRYRTGPKGYTRSDERLREDISERLMMADSIDSSEVTVSVKDCKVILEGTVPDRHMKHAIEDLVDAAPGVQDIDNRIRVGSGENPVR
jgi:hypothetical protein